MNDPVNIFNQETHGTPDYLLNPWERQNSQGGGNMMQAQPQMPQLNGYQRMAAAAPNPQVQAAMAAAQALRNPPAVTQPVPTGPQGQQFGARVAAPRFGSALTPPPEV